MKSKIELGEELKKELSKGYDVERISNWASNLYFSSRGSFPKEINDVLQFIFLMDAGPEFVHSENELLFLAEKLVNNEENPIRQVEDMKRGS
jgi:hypothetical protein